MNTFIYKSAQFSLLVQVITGIIDAYALTIHVKEKLRLLKELLILELSVQIVEGAFYIWLVKNISKTPDITFYRYFDWFFTTPTMLVTLINYLIFVRYEEEGKDTSELSILKIYKQEAKSINTVITLNASMLIFGFMGERKVMDFRVANILGFIPFFVYFKIIYDKYAKYTKFGKRLYYYFFIVWSFYGISSFLPYVPKNVVYNILDLFAKNFFGIYLAYLVMTHKSL